ncbi:MAG: hypothetical protein J6W88_03570 [Bacteroidales bacterium]|nr:hypothetical protein [Bacteroidales bacterium]
MKKAFPIVLVLLLATSCSIYHPQAVDMPLINHQGDLRVDASASTSLFIFLPDAININATASYGINDWLSGQVHANYGGDNWYMQAAPGGYLSLGGKAVAEAYLGIGYGGSNHDDHIKDSVSSYYSYKGQYLLPFAQVNIGWRNLGPFDIVFGLKSGLFAPDFKYYHYDDNSTGEPDKYIRYSTPNFLLEPQLQFGIGADKFKVTFRLGYTFMNDLNASSTNLYHDLFTLSAGFTLSF